MENNTPLYIITDFFVERKHYLKNNLFFITIFQNIKKWGGKYKKIFKSPCNFAKIWYTIFSIFGSLFKSEKFIISGGIKMFGFHKKKTNYGKIIAITVAAVAAASAIAFVIYKLIKKYTEDLVYDCDDLLDECDDCDLAIEDFEDEEEAVEAAE